MAITIADEMTAAATIACGETCARRLRRPKLARQLAVLAERVGEPREAGDRRRDRGEQDQRAGDADVEAERVAEPPRQLARRSGRRRRAAARGSTSCRARCSGRGTPRRATTRDRDVDRHDGARSPPKTRARQVDARAGAPPRRGSRPSRGPVNASIASGSAKAIACQRRVRAERRAVRQRVRREDEHEPEHDEQQLRQQVERRDDDPDAVERRPPDEPDRRDDHDHARRRRSTSHGLRSSAATCSAPAR